MRQARALFTATLLLFGCNQAPGVSHQDVSQLREPIIGGTPTTGDPSVVAVIARRPGMMGASLCTGAVIAPTVVLTAAHCVHPSTVGADAEFTVLAGPVVNDPNNPPERLAVRETHYDPLFNIGNLMGGHDIAVVILAEETGLAPLPINRAALRMDQVNQPARIVGYGLSNPLTQEGAGTKRTAPVRINGFNDNLVRTGDWFRRICSGDSGGPVFMNIDGTETIVGVNSFGFILCLFEGFSTRVDRYLDFLDTHL